MPTTTPPTVRQVREAAGITLTQLAQTVGIDPGYLSRLERQASTPSDDVAARIETALDVPAGTFVWPKQPAGGQAGHIRNLTEAVRQIVDALPDIDPDRRRDVESLLASIPRADGTRRAS